MPARAAKPWTAIEDRQLIALRNAGKTTGYIAKTMGRSEEGVRQRLGGIGLRSNGRLIKRRYADHLDQSS
jgi:predicted transcriptional regulator